ncbi:MAG: polysaccharide pyruvyl transferase CsaB [Clostridium sp. SCN 57-10]|nr:MAG: polysaccharide pyruvyl transferase CsaB [Clostridium sp. SCN 57-10]
MKIMHVAGGGDRGGAKTHIIALCSRLMRSCTLQLVSLRGGEFADEAKAAGIDTKVVFSRNIFRDYMRLVRHAKEYKPDIVHCHGAKANLAGVLLKLFCKCTIVTTVHSDYRLDYMHSALKRNTIGRLNAAALRRFDYHITVSDTFRDMLIERGFSPLKAFPIYNGLDFSVHTPPFDRGQYLRAAGLDYEEGDVVLGIPARLNPVKDLPTLLRAFALARAKNPRLKLIIGGDGEERSNLETLAKELGLGKSVSFFGWVSDVPRFFAACDIDVLCSISESFPYSVLEGIREHCAVITSDVGGMRKLIEHGVSGYIFRPRDVDTFASYILDLSMDHDKRRAFADRLYESASKAYSLESMADRQIEIYERVLVLVERGKTMRRDGVLICGAYGRGNSGDEAILKAILNTMHSVDPLMPLTVMTRKPHETALLHVTPAIYTFSIFKVLRAMRHSRLFINGGGSLIQDITSSRSLYFYLFTIWAAKRCGCKVLMYGCGIGRVNKGFNRRLASSVLSHNADIITLRDAVSRDELADMGVTGPDVRLSADPAMSLIPADAARADAYLSECGITPEGNYLCFSLRSWHDFSDYAIYARAAEYAYETYGLSAVFLPIELPRDLQPSRQTAEAMRTPYFLVETPRDVELTIALLRRMRLVCAMRLHALVFSAAAGVPFIATSYDIKVNGFADYVGSDSCKNLNELTAEWLCGEIDRAMAGRIPQASREALCALELENVRAARELLDAFTTSPNK